MSLSSEEVRIAAGEEERIEKAVEELRKNPHAPREISVKYILHVHNEYPKTLYKGKKTVHVRDAVGEQAAAGEGFGPYDHEAFTKED